MPKTGNNFIDFFSQVVIFFPLLPVFIIFFRRIYQKEALNYLVILCMLNFSQDITLQTLQIKYNGQLSIRHIFSLLEFIVIVQLFKTTVDGRLKEMINIFTIAIVSAMATYYLVKGAGEQRILLDILKNFSLVMLTAYTLVTIVHQENLRIFYSAIFWIATGTLFYFVIALLLDVLEVYRPHVQNSIISDKMLLLNIASLARYFFYTLATLLYIRQ